MKRLLVLAVAATATFGLSASADARPRCPEWICNALDQCYDTGEVRFCL